ncbi:MAG: DoxX family protein [Gemmatimonadota bacterium]
MHTSVLDLATLSVGLLIVRLVVGLLMAAHGSQKLFGWFGGYGITGTGSFLETIGFRPGRLFATLAAATEVVSGLLIALGLLGPVGPALMLSVMIVAAVSVHWKNGLFATTNGIELTLAYGTVAVGLALIGFGSYSLDARLGLQSLYNPTWAIVALAIGAIGGVGNLLARRPVAAAPAQS